MHLATDTATGMIRVDWFTPDGLPTWGDGRLIIVGTEGTIELRKYVDIAGRPGTDHLFLADKDGVRHIDCAGTDLPFGRQLLADVRDRTETAMPQARCFKAMEIALTAQMLAEESGQWRVRMTWNVGLVGLNIGRSHIVEGYVPNPAFRVATICDLDEARLAARRRRVRHRGPHARPSTTCSPIPRSTSSTSARRRCCTARRSRRRSPPASTWSARSR